MRFHKYQATGNDYLVLEADASEVDADTVRRLCDRRRGVGSDGVLFAVGARGEGAHGLRIVNPDGSPAGISGNGLRIFARYLHDIGRVGTKPFTVETPGRRVRCRVTADAAAVVVQMGRADFRSTRIPVAGPDREVVEEPFDVAGERVRVTAVGVGNPHAVVRVREATPKAIRRLGPALERHPAFPERTNVQLVEVADASHLRVQVWERGAGATLASGSSACAVVAAMRRLGTCGKDVQVTMPGGTLWITATNEYDLTMRGAVGKIAEGRVAEELLAAPSLAQASPPVPSSSR